MKKILIALVALSSVALATSLSDNIGNITTVSDTNKEITTSATTKTYSFVTAVDINKLADLLKVGIAASNTNLVTFTMANAQGSVTAYVRSDIPRAQA